MSKQLFCQVKNFILTLSLIRRDFLPNYKNIIFALVTTAFFFFLSVYVYKMVDSKTQNIKIGEIIKDPKMLRLVPYHLKIKRMCKYAAKNYRF